MIEKVLNFLDDGIPENDFDKQFWKKITIEIIGRFAEMRKTKYKN